MPSIRFLGAAGPLRLTLLVHREPSSLAAASSRLNNMGWMNRVPTHKEEVSLP